MSKKTNLFEEMKKQLINLRIQQKKKEQGMLINIEKKRSGLLVNFHDTEKAKLIGNIEHLQLKRELYLMNLEK